MSAAFGWDSAVGTTANHALEPFVTFLARAAGGYGLLAL